jgi:hypothetical protein
VKGGGAARENRKTYHEAKGEEGPAVEDVAGHVTAVVALAYDSLIAGELLAKGVFATDEEEEHGGRIGGFGSVGGLESDAGKAR